MPNNKKTISNLIIILILTHLSCDVQVSDESILRREFNIPASAKVASYEAMPKDYGWFGREGLKISMVFQFSDKDFDDYFTEAQMSGKWNLLPMSKEFLMYMGGIRSTKEGIIKEYQMCGEKLPEEGSVYNPTIEQLYDNFINKNVIPTHITNGLYQCRTAGDNIMQARKTICSKLDHDLNDFILAILDYNTKRMIIKVGTKY